MVPFLFACFVFYLRGSFFICVVSFMLLCFADMGHRNLHLFIFIFICQRFKIKQSNRIYFELTQDQRFHQIKVISVTPTGYATDDLTEINRRNSVILPRGGGRFSPI